MVSLRDSQHSCGGNHDITVCLWFRPLHNIIYDIFMTLVNMLVLLNASRAVEFTSSYKIGASLKEKHAAVITL